MKIQTIGICKDSIEARLVSIRGKSFEFFPTNILKLTFSIVFKSHIYDKLGAQPYHKRAFYIIKFNMLEALIQWFLGLSMRKLI